MEIQQEINFSTGVPKLFESSCKAGVREIGGHAYIFDNMRFISEDFLEKVLKVAIIYTEHRQQKTVKPEDVEYALEHPSTIGAQKVYRTSNLQAQA